MIMFRAPFSAFLVLATAVFLSSCSSVVIPGMASLKSSNSLDKTAPKAGRDFKLIRINHSVIKKQKHVNRGIKQSNRSAGVGGYQYLIGAQDILSITVWDHPELTIPAGEFRSATSAGHKVSADGYFFFPYAGKIHAAGLTMEQVRLSLEKKLSKYITNPQVGVAVAAYRSQRAHISGQVLKAGTYAINDVALTVRDMIAKSGGLSESASDVALLTHHKQKFNIDLDALYRKGDNRQNYVIRGGDTLHIGEKDSSEKVFVMGEVNDAGSVTISRHGLTLAEALSEAGSIREDKANPSGIFVVRQENTKDKKPSVYQLHLTSVHSMLLAEQFSLRSRDIVYVTAAPVTRWNRVISQLLPSLSVISSTRSLTR